MPVSVPKLMEFPVDCKPEELMQTWLQNGTVTRNTAATQRLCALAQAYAQMDKTHLCPK